MFSLNITLLYFALYTVHEILTCLYWDIRIYFWQINYKNKLLYLNIIQYFIPKIYYNVFWYYSIYIYIYELKRILRYYSWCDKPGTNYIYHVIINLEQYQNLQELGLQRIIVSYKSLKEKKRAGLEIKSLCCSTVFLCFFYLVKRSLFYFFTFAKIA